MFVPVKKLLIAVGLAGAARAQGISVIAPAPGTSLRSGEAFTIKIERPTPSGPIAEVGMAVGIVACPDNCDGNTFLGSDIFFNGLYAPQTTSAGKQSQTFSFMAPNYFDGLGQILVAHLYLDGVYSNAKYETAFVDVVLEGAVG